ncbi:MAG: M48 family peptidase [Actinomycetales bacterium]|nr:MAG: M48 family peptidase [Actinomycetales bacterium]
MSTKETLFVSGISVEVTRKEIKNLHLAVYPPNGRVTVSAPEPMSLDAIRVAVVTRLAWVKRAQKQIALAPRQSPREMVDGESHYYLGQRYRMKVVEQSGATAISIPNKSTMVLTCSIDTSLASKRKALESWYRARLDEIVPPLLDEWLEKFGLTDITWRIRSMKTKWATVDVSKRIITLNPELAKQNHDSFTAVIVHELSHFFERNHGEAFIAVMDAQLPDWRGRTSRLNQALLSTEDWKD